MPTRRPRASWASLALGLLVLGAMGLATVWVFLVPIFQSPDEHQHIDYSFGILEHGGLFTAESMEPGECPNYLVHPYTLYLMDRTNFWATIFHAEVKFPPDYGTAAYYRALDRDAPRGEELRVARPPSLTKIYPFGYYALLAAWMRLLEFFSGSLVVLFFGARMFSVLLLGCSLLFCYGTCRELRVNRLRSLVLTAMVGFFPLTTFIGSYVQPDNLSFTLVSSSLYLGLVVRRRLGSRMAVIALGVALGLLLVTKPHYYVAVLLPVAGMLAVELARPSVGRRVRLRTPVLLALPSIATGAVHLWTIRRTNTYYNYTAAHDDLVTFLVRGIYNACSDFIFQGETHLSFWGVFGWLDAPLVIGGPGCDAVVKLLILAGTLAVLGLTLVRFERLASRLILVARRGRPGTALRLLLANPAVNSCFLFFVMMLAIYIKTNNRFAAQGRNWLPLLLPIFFVTIEYAPRALSLQTTQRLLRATLAVGLLLYSTVGSYYALETIRARYYPAETTVEAVPPVAVQPGG